MSISLLAVHHGGGIGGAPVSLLKLLAGLNPDQFNAQAVFTEPGAVLGYARELGVNASTLQTGGALFYSAHARLESRSVWQFIRTFPGAVRAARQALRRERPDLIHLNTSVLLAWAAAARHEQIPVVWLVREVLGPNPWLRRWQANFILRHAQQTVAISDAVRDCFPEAARARIERVYNAVDLADFPPVSARNAQAARAELGIAPDAGVIMAIGSVQRVKGHWLLLDALARPELRHAELVLVAGGVGEEYAGTRRGQLKRRLGMPMDNLDALLRDATRRGVRDRVRVTGFRRDVARMLSAADVLAFASLEAEGFGRPIIEAMASGCPLVATDVGPSAEILGQHAGRLVAPDARSLAEALAELLRSPQTRQRMGQAGRRRVEEYFTLDSQVAHMSAIYQRTVRSA